MLVLQLGLYWGGYAALIVRAIRARRRGLAITLTLLALLPLPLALMGAVLNMRPDLWAGVLSGVPFVDVINTMSDTTLPLTPPEWAEWGNPLTDPKAYDYMMSYSPYDNVRPHVFPPVLATCGLTDPRVTYWEPAKWVARLRRRKTDQNLLLLRTEMEAGHGGVSGRFQKLKERAEQFAFFLMLEGKK